MPITPRGRWSPNDGDEYDLITDLAAMQVSNEEATDTQIDAIPDSAYRSDLTDAQRLALSGASLFEGLRVRPTDTKREWMYTSGAWISADNGVFLITPTLANLSNATVSADGSILLSNASPSSWSEIRNVFSSRFRNYLILYTLTGNTTSAGTVRFMNGVSQDASTSYGNARAYITTGGAYTPAYNGGETSGRLIAVNTSGAMSGKMALSDPTDGANNTTAIWDTMGGGLPSNGGINAAVSVHNGIAFQRNAGTMGGYVKIYGYA